VCRSPRRFNSSACRKDNPNLRAAPRQFRRLRGYHIDQAFSGGGEATVAEIKMASQTITLANVLKVKNRLVGRLAKVGPASRRSPGSRGVRPVRSMGPPWCRPGRNWSGCRWASSPPPLPDSLETGRVDASGRAQAARGRLPTAFFGERRCHRSFGWVALSSEIAAEAPGLPGRIG
jgi:hypothetical protein